MTEPSRCALRTRQMEDVAEVGPIASTTGNRCEERLAAMDKVLAYLGAGIVAAWGVAHVVPTRAVLVGFGAISPSNRRVLAQEWLAEAFTMWFVAAVVIVTAALGAPGAPLTTWLYRVSALMLVAIGTLTAATGGRTEIVWFKICPVVLAVVAGLWVTASLV